MAAPPVVTRAAVSSGYDRHESGALCALEDALATEIGRRAGFESWAADRVEALVGSGVRRAQNAVEDQLASLHRRFAEEIRERLAAVEQEIGSARHRLARIEQGAAGHPPAPEGCDGMTMMSRRALSSLEDRVAWLERSMSKPLETIPLEVARHLQLIRTQLLDESAERCQHVVDTALADSGDVRRRLNELELWLEETVAPAVVRTQLDLQTERGEREMAIAELKGFALEGQAAKPLPVGSTAVPSNGDLLSEDVDAQQDPAGARFAFDSAPPAPAPFGVAPDDELFDSAERDAPHHRAADGPVARAPAAKTAEDAAHHRVADGPVARALAAKTAEDAAHRRVLERAAAAAHAAKQAEDAERQEAAARAAAEAQAAREAEDAAHREAAARVAAEAEAAQEAASEPAAAITVGSQGDSPAAWTPRAGDAEGRGTSDEGPAAAQREAQTEEQQRKRQLMGIFRKQLRNRGR